MDNMDDMEAGAICAAMVALSLLGSWVLWHHGIRLAAPIGGCLAVLMVIRWAVVHRKS